MDMKKGFTTGTAAAGAAKAHAVYIQTGTPPESVDVIMPDGGVLTLAVHSCSDGGACVRKDAGDDPDVTHGALICAHVEPGGEFRFIGGIGVGTVTKAGLQIPVGEPAINPVPRQMIIDNLRSAGITGASVTISVPAGERLADATFNSRIGIEGGISIIGTTGIVEPMSVEALKATIECEIDVLYENGCRYITFVPGKIGEKHIHRLYPDVGTVIMSNYIGFALEYARGKGVRHIRLAGHPGKLAKAAMGYYDTHSKNSPMAQAFIAEKLGLTGDFNTAEEICAVVSETGLDIIAELISRLIMQDYGMKADVVLFDMAGNLKGRYDG